jgi:hypothetical protein
MYDPSLSLDAVVASTAERYMSLAAEAARLDLILSGYASRPECETVILPVVPAVQHYPLTEGAECGCTVCAEWDMRRGEFVAAARLVPKAHKWSTCGCGVCRFVGRIHLNFLAATNTRDLLIETSYHARHHSPFGEQVMQWLAVELANPKYTVNWRAQEMSRYPMEWWFRRCEAVLGPIVSGAVFRDGMHVVDAQVHFGSSLAADGEIVW